MALIVMISVFAAGLIAIFVGSGFLLPSSSEGDLNTDKVEGGRNVKPQSF